MRGRVLGIKKTNILRCSFFIVWLLIITETVLSIVLLKNNYLWFYGFCLLLGLHLLIKASLFRLDSSCYFGFLLFFIGLSGIFWNFLPISNYIGSMLIFSFFLASFMTFLFYRQRFQLFIAFILFFAGACQLLFEIKLIPFWISLAIGGVGVLLFILKYLFFVKRS